MSDIEAQLKKFSKTKRFRELVETAQRKAIQAGKPFGTGKDAISPQYIKNKCEEMKFILWKEVSSVIPSIALNDIEIGTPMLGEDGYYEVNIGFKRDRISRPSLWPEKYGEVDNIVLLFSHGYNARDHVYGTWHNERYASRMSRQENDFMERAVSNFNKKNDTTQAELDEMYQN